LILSGRPVRQQTIGPAPAGFFIGDNMGRFIDLTGQRFGRWLVKNRGGLTKNGHPKWECRCECGNIREVPGSDLRYGQSKSCGCWNKNGPRKAPSRHGMSYTPEYHIWALMLQRCRNSNWPGYRYYGGRGISVCERWLDFENFYADIGPRPSPELSIDRINNNGNYEPNNCRWADAKTQNNNQRRNQCQAM